MAWILAILVFVVIYVVYRNTTRNHKTIDDTGGSKISEQPASIVSLSVSTSYSYANDDDYEKFVRQMWSKQGVSGAGITIQRITDGVSEDLVVHTLVDGKYGIYINAFLNGIRKTYAADNRCKWSRDGKWFKAEAFRLAYESGDVDGALRHEKAPDFSEYPLPERGSVDGLIYEIDYANRHGEVTNRVVKLDTVYADVGSVFISGFCYLRNETRTFRSDRILALRYHKDGQQIIDPHGYFKRFVVATTDRDLNHRAAMKKARKGLEILTWIAGADGEISETEMMVLLQFIDDRAAGGRSGTEACEQDRDLSRYEINNTKVTEVYVSGVAAKIKPNSIDAVLTLKFINQLKTDVPTRLLISRAKKMERFLSAGK